MPIGVPLTIGPVALASNVMLAPVANYCDLAFRIITRAWGGVGLACTDLLSPHGLLRGTQQSLDLARTHDLDQPVGMQLYGRDPDILADGARWAVAHGATVVDINMGCPVDKVAKKNGGSLLLRDACATQRLTERVVEAVDRSSGGRVPTTAKLRLGWDDDSIVAPTLARALEKIGVAAITIHGRTTEQRFRGSVRLDGIAQVVGAVENIPVIGNGDVRSPGDCVAMIERTGCAGVMIGRGAFARPWIFRDCWALQTDGAAPAEPTEHEKIESIRRYFDLMLDFRGERYALTHIRTRISWFGKALGPCKGLRMRLQGVASPEDVHAALDEFLAGGLRSCNRERAGALTAERMSA
ncbi:MAG: tRNA dihydrouridine synthase DusB [Phycisphaeraceae bacterium]|nr:tRNA dihydrouridine synthase DusB [Phycisphaeraceae bacterium]MCB9847768.1 tRNA dihydrouridine synthase DusB [Phycisphaeraceae bacterium]